MYRFVNKIFIVAFLLMAIIGCKKWEEHTEVNDPKLTLSLAEEINSRLDLTKFNEYLKKTGLDSLLNSSKTFTVWAPTNDALQTLDAATINDVPKLKNFLLNHISNQSYFTAASNASVRVPMLNGKYNSFFNGKFDDAPIIQPDRVAANGVLHIINKTVPPLPNIWDFINSTALTIKQDSFIVSQNFDGFNPQEAIIDSFNSVTGQPIYKPGTGVVKRNRFNERVLNTGDESKTFTYFVMKDDAFKVEADSLSKYFVTGTVDSTNMLTRWAVTKDMIFEGTYTPDKLPDTLVSKFGVVMRIRKSDIDSTRKMSNGIIYFMKKVDFFTREKILPFIIQGEGKIQSLQSDRTANTTRRTRTNPFKNTLFSDIVISGHGVSGYWVNYRQDDAYSAKYKVYWVAVNDFTPTFMQKLAMGTLASTTFPLTNVPFSNPSAPLAASYNEVLLGEYTTTKFGNLDMFLTANGTGPLTLDYIRLEPVIQ